jgi:hypothetical protein
MKIGKTVVGLEESTIKFHNQITGCVTDRTSEVLGGANKNLIVSL